jgi:DNA mismatch endonuclease (patch repair protein)
MRAVRGRENRAEVLLRKALWHHGVRYRVHDRRLPGRPDLVLSRHRAVIFVDGDFWHGRVLIEKGDEGLREVIRGARFDWWREKLQRNVSHDEKVTQLLSIEGWRVKRVWESEILSDVDSVATNVMKWLRGGSRR